MSAVAAALALSDVLLAVVVFMWWLRPEAGMGVVARCAGQWADLRDGRMADADRARLLWAAKAARGPLLLLLFLWSFAVGVVLSWSRLQ